MKENFANEIGFVKRMKNKRRKKSWESLFSEALSRKKKLFYKTTEMLI